MEFFKDFPVLFMPLITTHFSSHPIRKFLLLLQSSPINFTPFFHSDKGFTLIKVHSKHVMLSILFHFPTTPLRQHRPKLVLTGTSIPIAGEDSFVIIPFAWSKWKGSSFPKINSDYTPLQLLFVVVEHEGMLLLHQQVLVVVEGPVVLWAERVMWEWTQQQVYP